MRKHQFWMALLAVTQAGLIPSIRAQQAAPAEPPSVREADGLIWHNVTAWGVEGRMLPEEERERWFDRFPAKAKEEVPPAVWRLSRDSAGMMIRFRTDALEIHVQYRLMDNGLAMPHMPATGVSGIDLYARDQEGAWKWVQVTKPTKQEMKVRLISGLEPGEREYAAYLPLYNGVDSVEIGVPQGARFEGLSPRARPLVFYGTSITHGACASRPGIVHTAILGRRLDRPVVNLGFSGNGKMDLSVGQFMTRIDASIYVIDCLPNMNADLVRKRCVPLVKLIRSARPDTPIVLVEDRRFTNDWITPAKRQFHTENHAALRECFDQLRGEGLTRLHYIEGDYLYGKDTEGATDASHANDLGFMRQADAFEPVIRAALEGG